ncbi:hypothetical protein NFC73_00765 [Pseudarthrobacter sp. RMG13]|uniref:Uncharacterized protein n=1 Tax=Pseudarthrobacter humi TaxID=2952523 RepID=A0ABT1LM51_9MICC|nr:hypothetical protein [Pseudarthrobacter humi]MCP8998271.1 hypothetical protein [Pseudarthrobacter humi]
MTSPETAVEIALDVLADLTSTGADPRGPLGSGAAWTINEHGTQAQKARLQRIEAAAQRKHGAEPSRTAGMARTGAADSQGMDALDRAIAKDLGLDEA